MQLYKRLICHPKKTEQFLFSMVLHNTAVMFLLLVVPGLAIAHFFFIKSENSTAILRAYSILGIAGIFGLFFANLFIRLIHNRNLPK